MSPLSARFVQLGRRGCHRSGSRLPASAATFCRGSLARGSGGLPAMHHATTVGHPVMRHLGLSGDLFGAISSGLRAGCGLLSMGRSGVGCGGSLLGGIGSGLGALRRGRGLLRRLLCSQGSVPACAASSKHCERHCSPGNPDKFRTSPA